MRRYLRLTCIVSDGVLMYKNKKKRNCTRERYRMLLRRSVGTSVILTMQMDW